jgi:hypothetical protein
MERADDELVAAGERAAAREGAAARELVVVGVRTAASEYPMETTDFLATVKSSFLVALVQEKAMFL